MKAPTLPVLLHMSRDSVARLAAEYDSNPSSFVRAFAADVLREVASVARRTEDMSREINLINPFSDVKGEAE